MGFTALVRHCVALALFGIAFLGASPEPGLQSIPFSTFQLSLSDNTAVELTFSADPQLTDCRLVTSATDRQVWRCSDYSLELRISRGEGADLITFTLRSLDGFPNILHEHSTRVSVPSSPGDALWTFNRQAEQDIMETNLARSWVFFSAANRGIPFIALVDKQGWNKLALGLLEQDHTVLLRGESSQDKKSYVLTLRQMDNAAGGFFRDTIYISRNQDSWFHNTQRFAAEVDHHLGYVPPEMPEAVLNPTYDSWYWTLDRINQETTWNLATLSRSVGFKTYLIDAGWDTHTGEYIKGLKGSTGDYWPPAENFPNFSGLINDIRSRLGMKVMLWIQQYAMGRRSVYYPEFGSALCSVEDPTDGGLAETPMLCPKTSNTRRHMRDLFGRILDTYRPDALWFDWQEEIPQACDALHFHDSDRFGSGYNATQRAIMSTIRQYSPDIFIDMRWPFANLNNKAFTHLWQPIDSAGDYEAMRLRAMVMRPFSAGLVMGTDEMYWDPRISDIEAARFMAAVIFTGVPYFGPNLPAEPTSRIEMLKAWLRFYETNKKDLVGGDFSPYGNRDRPDQLIEGQQATFIYYGNRYTDPIRLTRANNKLYVVNSSISPGIELTVTGLELGRYRAEVSDRNLNSQRSSFLTSRNANLWLRFDVPIGCLLTLTRIQ